MNTTLLDELNSGGGWLHCQSVIRAAVQMLHPAVQQSNFLAESGFRVSNLCWARAGSHKGADFIHARIKSHCGVQSLGQWRALAARFSEVRRFGCRVRSLARRSCPKILIMSDAESAYVVGAAARSCMARLIWHLDHIPEEHTDSVGAALANRFVRRRVALTSLITKSGACAPTSTCRRRTST